MINMLPSGYAGKMGYASAGALADFIVVEHGRRGGVRFEDAEGSGGAGAEAGGALLQGLTLRGPGPDDLPAPGFAALDAGPPDARQPRPGSIPPMATRQSALARALDDRHLLGLVFMLPAAALLLLFLTYPLGLGTYLGFTDTKIGRAGVWIGLENFEFLWGDDVTRLALFNTLFYTVVASVIKFGLGLWLALLLNKHLPFKAFLRAVVLLPFIVPTALSAIAFWWIYDSQFSIISWTLVKMGVIDTYIDFLGQPWMARLRRRSPPTSGAACPSSRSRCSPGLQTISPSYYEAASLDGASPWQQFRYVTLPLLTPIIAVVMTFSVLFTFTDFQLIYVLTRGGPLNATHLMATLSFQRAIPGGSLGEGAAIATAMVPFLLAAILCQLLRAAAPRLAAGRGGRMSERAECSRAARRPTSSTRRG